ncbi:MAG: 2,3-bisphosphoglycerate-independent phosphoglycerate mutase [Polyangiaceae bacterium]|jgi:2,3-bisphosphoglycerate-independent phosphoglycerate mutase|nr:2,3-bisphosphoglycerate-independent phosphoglycerate mutase [Polyangiaceae bacterium]
MSEFTLRRHSKFQARRGPVMICVMDGIGLGAENEGNAVHLARTPTIDWLLKHCPSIRLRAHGTAVGLPSDDDMGNSEVGHNALGAGRVFDQGSKLVGKAIETGALFQGQVWQATMKQIVPQNKALHLIGLLSDGNVHSHIDQLFALIRRAHEDGVARLYVHPLLDGRDVPETSGLQYVDALEALLTEIRQAPDRDYRVASGGGRMLVTMDRYNANWAVVKRGWEAHVHGHGRKFESARQAVETYRSEQPGIADQNLPEFVIAKGGEPIGRITDGDAIVFFNFRGDRAIEISRAFDEDNFAEFDRGRRPNVLFAGMMQYDGDLRIPKRFLVEPPSISRTVGEYLARNGLRQMAVSETQKYGHVTYFWNGNRGGKFSEDLETYVCVPSDLRPFDERPWMKAAEITDRFIDELQTSKYAHLRVNYANGDMVGHTGVREAAVLAVEAVDLSVARLMKATRQAGGVLIVTADHGNADEMYELDKKTGTFKVGMRGELKPKTAHTLNPVPLVIYDPEYDGEYRVADIPHPGLSNVAATLLNLMGFEAPEDYDRSLITFDKKG